MHGINVPFRVSLRTFFFVFCFFFLSPHRLSLLAFCLLGSLCFMVPGQPLEVLGEQAGSRVILQGPFRGQRPTTSTSLGLYFGAGDSSKRQPGMKIQLF